MIYRLEGIVLQIDGALVVVAVNGIGLGVFVSHAECYLVGEAIVLYSAWHWNQETGPQLFGFATADERDFFQLLTSCSGWGPKLALSLLQQTTAAECSAAIMLGDRAKLSSFKGIGTKKAESLILQLRDKVDKLPTQESGKDAGFAVRIKDVADALQALRYSPAEVATALEIVKKQENVRSAPFDQLLRVALGYLSKGGR